MKKYNLAILGIIETRWPQSREKTLTSEKLLYSGHGEEIAPHTGVCTDALRRSTKTHIMGFSCLQDYQSILQNKEMISVNVIHCYAPKNVGSGDDKVLWEVLVHHRELLRKMPNHLDEVPEY